jgi:hypothetical protein
MNRQDLNTILAIVLPILFSAGVGLLVWKIQSGSTAKAQKLAAEALAKAEDEKKKREDIAAGHQALLNRVSELEKQGVADTQTLALLKQEMLPMAEAMKRKLVEILTHPSDEFEIPDAIVAKVNVIGSRMTQELATLLVGRAHSTNPHVTEQEKLAAEALPIIMRLAELEAKDVGVAEITHVQLVSSTMKSAATKRAEEG